MATDTAFLVDIPPELMRDDLERREPCGSRFNDLTGSTHGVLKVVGLAGYLKQYSAWLCECECGELAVYRANKIVHCPPARCYHDCDSHHPLYGTWRGMQTRCDNPNSPAYAHYGERGIDVCERWRDSFRAFLDDMGPRPSDRHSVDRIDNDGNYEPGNCRWATANEQARNTRSNRYIEHGGETLTMSEWANKIGITPERMRQRLNKLLRIGADPAIAVTTPPGETMEPLKGYAPGRKRMLVAKEEWFTGEVCILRRGEDFSCSPEAMCAALRTESIERNGKATTRKLGGFVLFRHDAKKFAENIAS